MDSRASKSSSKRARSRHDKRKNNKIVRVVEEMKKAEKY